MTQSLGLQYFQNDSLKMNEGERVRRNYAFFEEAEYQHIINLLKYIKFKGYMPEPSCGGEENAL